MRINNNGRTLAKTALFCLVFLPGTVAGWPGGGEAQRPAVPPAPSASSLLVKLVTLRARGEPATDEIFQLGREQQIPLGFECVDRDLTENPIRLNVGPVRLAGLLNLLFPPSRGYFFRERHGAVVVSCRAAARLRGNLLGLVLPEFSIPRCTMAEASHLLQLAVLTKLNPQVGTAGEYSPGGSASLIGPLRIRNEQVRDVLNRIVSMGPKGAWIAQAPPPFLTRIPQSGLWRVVAYDDPGFASEAGILRESLLSYPKE